MKLEEVRAAIQTSNKTICDNITKYVVDPAKDFTRKPRKLSPEELFNFLITKGGDSTKNEIWDVGIDPADPPTEGALVRARAKLKPEGFKAFLREFGRITHDPLPAEADGYRRLAFDGTRIIFQSDKRYAGDEYYIQTQPGIRGTYCMHTSALYDLETCTYVGGTIDAIREYSEKDAFLKCIDSYRPYDGEKPLFIVDRNFESYNLKKKVIR